MIRILLQPIKDLIGILINRLFTLTLQKIWVQNALD